MTLAPRATQAPLGCKACAVISGRSARRACAVPSAQRAIPARRDPLVPEASALRISIAPKNTAAPVLVDLRRTTIYDGSTIETQTLNGSSISASIAIDGTVYTNSQETHNMRIRQQDPITKLWSMCEINSFLSAGGARCSIRIQWSEYDVAYAAPTV